MQSLIIKIAVLNKSLFKIEIKNAISLAIYFFFFQADYATSVNFYWLVPRFIRFATETNECSLRI